MKMAAVTVTANSNDGGKNSPEEKVADPGYEPEKLTRPKTKHLPAPKKTTTEQCERPVAIEKPAHEADVCQTDEEKSISSWQEEERHNDTKPGETTKEEKLKKKSGHHCKEVSTPDMRIRGPKPPKALPHKAQDGGRGSDQTQFYCGARRKEEGS